MGVARAWSISPERRTSACQTARRRGPAVRVDVRAPSRSAVFRYGQHVSAVERVFTRHNPLVFQVRETVEGHNHAKLLIVVALVMRTSNDRRTSPARISLRRRSTLMEGAPKPRSPERPQGPSGCPEVGRAARTPTDGCPPSPRATRASRHPRSAVQALECGG